MVDDKIFCYLGRLGNVFTVYCEVDGFSVYFRQEVAWKLLL